MGKIDKNKSFLLCNFIVDIISLGTYNVVKLKETTLENTEVKNVFVHFWL